MAKKIKSDVYVYLVQADNGEEYAEDRTEFTAGVFTTEEAAINFVKTSSRIPEGCDSVTVELWNASINERVGYFELERYESDWKRWNEAFRAMVTI